MRALLPLLLGLLAADEITLVDGRTLEGELTSEPGAAEVVLKTSSGGMVAMQRFPAAQVRSIFHGQTPLQAAVATLDARRKTLGTGGDATAWWRLAEDYRAQGEAAQGKRCAQVVIERDPDHEAARALLGWVRYDGRWLRPTEAAVARGQVLFRGRWVMPAERDAVLAEEARVAAEAQARREQRRAEDRADAVVRRERAEAAAAEAAAEPQAWAVFGQVQPVPSILQRNPRLWACPPTTVTTVPATPAVQIQAAGNSGGVQWSAEYRR